MNDPADQVKYDPTCIDLDHIVVFQMKRFGYEPDGEIAFNAVYGALCRNPFFCAWIRSLVPAEIIADPAGGVCAGGDMDNRPESVLLESDAAGRAHIWLGEHCPIWARRWSMLLGVLAAGQWDRYVL
jgi:hypothetical protein